MIQTLADALAERGYDTLTAVQQAVTDPELRDADLLVSAQTGSGKTVGFGLAIAGTLMGEAEQLGPAAAPLALVIAPTRELAVQVMRELGWLYAGAGARLASCVGGMDMRTEVRALDRGAHIVVGTPGRLRDHIQRGSLDMGSLRAIVLDEADEMLDLGFREDLEFMLDSAPEDRRTLMFSATVPAAIAALAGRFQRDAVRVNTVAAGSQHADISYQAMRVAQVDAENAIINTLRFHEPRNAIVFANTRAAVSRLAARFGNRGFAVVALSGELSQAERTHALQAMRDGRAQVCVATDVAARGIDLPELELVIHADLPGSADTLLHRSGRTGRAGRKGISALVVPPRATRKAERLLREARIEAEWRQAPSAEEVLARDEERLLTDPVWAEPVPEDLAGMTERLLAAQPAEAIAAAYLRMWRDRHAPPEDLTSPDAKPARAERAPFGPSAWVSLSVGSAEGAEPRWLLPMLLRAGDLDRNAIGAIRVRDAETFVEIAEGSIGRLLSAAAGGLEKGITLRKLDAAPDLGGGRPAARPPRGDRPQRPDREKRGHRGSRPPRDAGEDAAPRQDRRESKAAEPVQKPESAPRPEPAPAQPERPRNWSPVEGQDAAPAEAPAPRKPAKSWGKPAGKAEAGGKGKPAGKGKPSWRDAAPERGAKGGKPARDARKGGAAPGGKPAAKAPAGARPTASGPRPGAADPSRSFARPGKPAKAGKPGKSGPVRRSATKSAPRRNGGNDVPRRRDR